jgi:hypothetical protein
MIRRSLLAAAALFALAGAAPAEAREPGQAHPVVGASCDETSHYINASGHCVHRPMQSDRPPAGASARCRDGSYSFSEHHRGTCSRHGGVANWL